MSGTLTLRELEIGERFISASQNNKRNPTKFKVLGKNEFNLTAGTATRSCLNETTREVQNKHSKLIIIKLPIK